MALGPYGKPEDPTAENTSKNELQNLKKLIVE
jgi:hypothetical protein